MAAFKVPSSTKEPFSCQENSLTGHGKWGEPNQLPEFLITNPSPGAWDTGRGSGQGRGGWQEAGSHSPVLPVQINKMLPQGKSSRVQVQNRCLEKETKKEKMSMKRFYHYLTMNFNNCSKLALTFHSLPSKNSRFQPLGSQYNIYFTTTNLPHIPAEMQRLLRYYKKKSIGLLFLRFKPDREMPESPPMGSG